MITATQNNDTTPNEGVNNTRIGGVQYAPTHVKIADWMLSATDVRLHPPAWRRLGGAVLGRLGFVRASSVGGLLPFIVVLVLATLLSGCGSTPPASPSVRVPPPTPAAIKASLFSEQRRLAELFRGTPVIFAMQPDGSMRVEVPLRYCFDSGAVAVKPPLAAVLDRVALSQRDEPTRLTVTAPIDTTGKGLPLAAERSLSTRDYLVAHGIASKRMAIAPAGGKNIRIIVAEGALP
jgi:hypothetical protein